jgi:hypothetical protein
MFNTDEFFKKNIKDTDLPTETNESRKSPHDFSIDELISINIVGLLKKANINDDFDKGVYLVLLKNILKKEMAKLRAAHFSDEAPREVRLQQIQKKIQQINLFNTTNFDPLNPQTKLVEDDMSSDTNRKQDTVSTIPNAKRTRKTNLIRAIEAAVKRFYEKPSLDDLWSFFEDGKDETIHIIDCNQDKITWSDSRGKFHDTKKNTVRNQLARIKK